MSVTEEDLARHYLTLNGYGNFAIQVLQAVGENRFDRFVSTLELWSGRACLRPPNHPSAWLFTELDEYERVGRATETHRVAAPANCPRILGRPIPCWSGLVAWVVVEELLKDIFTATGTSPNVHWFCGPVGAEEREKHWPNLKLKFDEIRTRLEKRFGPYPTLFSDALQAISKEHSQVLLSIRLENSLARLVSSEPVTNALTATQRETAGILRFPLAASESGTAVPRGQHSTPGSDNPVPNQFTGGELVFFEDRVEICGVDVCSGPRSESRRAVLELLGRRKNGASFVAYSGDNLELQAKQRGAKGTAGEWIRDLRDDITAALRTQANIIAGPQDVILSGGPGYRFAECLTVRNETQAAITDITDTADRADVRDVFDAPDDEATRRRGWIVQQLQSGIRLKAPTVAEQFKRTKKTAQRDLDALRDEGKIEFVGDPRTGYYRLVAGK